MSKVKRIMSACLAIVMLISLVACGRTGRMEWDINISDPSTGAGTATLSIYIADETETIGRLCTKSMLDAYADQNPAGRIAALGRLQSALEEHLDSKLGAGVATVTLDSERYTRQFYRNDKLTAEELTEDDAYRMYITIAFSSVAELNSYLKAIAGGADLEYATYENGRFSIKASDMDKVSQTLSDDIFEFKFGDGTALVTPKPYDLGGDAKSSKESGTNGSEQSPTNTFARMFNVTLSIGAAEDKVESTNSEYWQIVPGSATPEVWADFVLLDVNKYKTYYVQASGEIPERGLLAHAIAAATPYYNMDSFLLVPATYAELKAAVDEGNALLKGEDDAAKFTASIKRIELAIAGLQNQNNLALGKETEADPEGSEYGTFLKENAVDGVKNDISRIWGEEWFRPRKPWIYIDLGEVTDVNNVLVYWCYEPALYKVEVSKDAENWKVVDTREFGNSATYITDGSYESHTFKTEKARYVRIYIEEQGRIGSCLYEIEAYNNPNVVMDFELLGTQKRTIETGKEYDMRFITKLVPDYFNTNKAEITALGTLMARKDQLEAAGLTEADLKVEMLEYAAPNGEKDQYTVIVGGHALTVAKLSAKSLSTGVVPGAYCYTNTILGITKTEESNMFTRQYACVAYAQFKDGTTKYTNYETRSMQEILDATGQ